MEHLRIFEVGGTNSHGRLVIDLKRGAAPVVAGGTRCYCCDRHRRAPFIASVNDSHALIYQTFWEGGQLEVTVQRIRDMVKAIHHLQPGFSVLTRTQRQVELQRLLSL